MVIRLKIENVGLRVVTILLTTGILFLLAGVVVREFTIGTLSDQRYKTDRAVLSNAAEYFPGSPRLLFRLARDEMYEFPPDLKSAERHILQVINLSPNNYDYRMMLAKIKELDGDQAGAELALVDALKLAPNNHVVHWQMANLLVREGKVDESLEHFHFAVNLNPAVLPYLLDLLWTVSDRNIPTLKKIVQDNPPAQLKLAVFLVSKSQVAEAAEIFQKVDKDTILLSPDASPFFDSLLSKGFPKLANDLWLQINKEKENQSTVWNGDFETESSTPPAPAQFNWRIGKSDYARIYIDNKQGHTGTHSLRVDFLGRDTTRLDDEVKHLLVVRPGINYRLEFFVKTEDLRTPEGPRVVVTDSSGNRVAESEPISTQTADWKPLFVNFTAPRKTPADAAVLFISIKRQPHYAYDEPTRGHIWFDDFAVSELNTK